MMFCVSHTFGITICTHGARVSSHRMVLIPLQPATLDRHFSNGVMLSMTGKERKTMRCVSATSTNQNQETKQFVGLRTVAGPNAE
jgi:hypothetical protein